jgi:hypothetical protein
MADNDNGHNNHGQLQRPDSYDDRRQGASTTTGGSDNNTLAKAAAITRCDDNVPGCNDNGTTTG